MPLLWDVCSISVYLTASTIYLFLPLIPDIAVLRDYGAKPAWLYRLLGVGWCASETQKRLLNRAISVMAVLVIPIAISVHTVVSWVFAMTVQPMWHSSIFGPYFVVGAIFSGIASLLIVMALIRRIYLLQNYLKPIHFNNLGLLLLVMALLWDLDPRPAVSHRQGGGQDDLGLRRTPRGEMLRDLQRPIRAVCRRKECPGWKLP